MVGNYRRIKGDSPLGRELVLNGDRDPLRFGLAKAQAIATQFKLQWIAQRCFADERYRRSGNQSHLEQPRAYRVGSRQLPNDAGLASLERRQRERAGG